MAVIVIEAALNKFGFFKTPVERVLPFVGVPVLPYLLGTWHWFRWKAAEQRGDPGDYTPEELTRRRPLGVLTFAIAGLCVIVVFFLTRLT
jgi:hypothetical protein